MSNRYIVVGGNPFRMYNGTTTFTSLREVGRCDTEEELNHIVRNNYDECGGLLYIVDSQNPPEKED